MTAWYAGLLMGALLVFGLSVYLGLERYLDSTLQAMLASDCRTIGTQLLSQLPGKNADWLKTEINEAYAPEVNARFIRVYQEGAVVIYLSGSPKDEAFDPSEISLHNEKRNGARQIRVGSGQHLLINEMSFTT